LLKALAQLDEKKEAIAKLNFSVDQLNQELDNIEYEMSYKDEKYETLKQEMDDLSVSKDGVTVALEQAKVAMQAQASQCDQLTGSVSKLSEEISLLQAKNVHATSEISELKDANVQAKIEIENARSNNDALRSAVAEKERKCLELMLCLQQAESHIFEGKSINFALQNDISELKEANIFQRSQLTQLEADKKSVIAMNDVFEAKLKQGFEELQEVKERLIDEKQNSDMLSCKKDKQIVELEAEVQACKQALSAVEQALQTDNLYEASLEACTLAEQVSQLSMLKNSLLTKNEAANTKIYHLSAENKELDSKHGLLSAAHMSLTTTNEELTARLSVFKSRHQEIKNNNSSLLAQVKDFQAKDCEMTLCVSSLKSLLDSNAKDFEYEKKTVSRAN